MSLLRRLNSALPRNAVVLGGNAGIRKLTNGVVGPDLEAEAKEEIQKKEEETNQREEQEDEEEKKSDDGKEDQEEKKEEEYKKEDDWKSKGYKRLGIDDHFVGYLTAFALFEHYLDKVFRNTASHKITKVDGKVTTVGTQLDGIKTTVDDFNRKLVVVGDVKEVEGKLETLGQKVDANEKKLETLKTKVDEQEKQRVVDEQAKQRVVDDEKKSKTWFGGWFGF